MENQTNNGKTRTQASRMSMNDTIDSIIKGNKAGGIIVSICMIILGILIFLAPVITGLGIAYVITVGFIVFGFYSVIAYIRTPRDYKNGWTLANGIIYILLGVLILAEALGGKIGQVEMLSTFAFLIGFFALFGGITQISSYGIYKNSGAKGAGLLLLSGIINIILGIIVICSPLAGWFAVEWVFGIYLIVGGIALFAEACSGKLAFRK